MDYLEYGRPYSRRGRFGLMCGQMRGRSCRVMKNAGWYDAAGRKLGWGDLSDADMRRIAAGLRKGELFIVLSETASWWEFVTFIGRGKKRRMKVSRREKAPGKKYLAEKASHILAPRKPLLVDRFGRLKRRRVRVSRLTFAVIRGDETDRIIIGP